MHKLSDIKDFTSIHFSALILCCNNVFFEKYTSDKKRLVIYLNNKDWLEINDDFIMTKHEFLSSTSSMNRYSFNIHPHNSKWKELEFGSPFEKYEFILQHITENII